MGCCALCWRICNALVAEGGSLELLIGRHWALCGDLLGWRPHIHNGGGGGLQGGDGGSHWGGGQHNGGMQLHWKLLGHLRHPCYSDGGTPPGRILAHLWEQGHSVVLCEIFKYIKKILHLLPSCLSVLGAERQLLSRQLNMFLSLRECRWQHS